MPMRGGLIQRGPGLGVVSSSGSSIGSIIRSTLNPGSNWLLCNGATYASANYPALGALLPPSPNGPIVSNSGIVQYASQGQNIAYGNGRFVLTCSSGYNYSAILVSTSDGQNWTTTRPVGSGQNSCIAFGNNTFVYIDSYLAAATTPAGSLLTSPDGLTWTSRTKPGTLASSDYPQSLTFLNGLFFLITGTNNLIYSSPDGITWTSVATTNIPGYSMYGIAYGNGYYILASNINGSIYATTSLTSGWTSYSTPLSGYIKGVGFLKGTFCAIGNTGSMLLSTSATSWPSASYSALAVQPAASGGNAPGGQIYSDGTYMYIPTSYNSYSYTQTPIAITQDFINFTQVGIGPYSSYSALGTQCAAFVNGIFVAGNTPTGGSGANPQAYAASGGFLVPNIPANQNGSAYIRAS